MPDRFIAVYIKAKRIDSRRELFLLYSIANEFRTGDKFETSYNSILIDF